MSDIEWQSIMHGFKEHVEWDRKLPSTAGRAAVLVPLNMSRSFSLFTADIGRWWQTAGPHWNDVERRLGIRFEAGEGGRLIEVWHGDGDGFTIGRILEWLPPVRLSFSWRELDWPEIDSSIVIVEFAQVANGTQIRVIHIGFDLIARRDLEHQYSAFWREALGWFGAYACRIESS